jgi:hypothetical protein
LQQIWLNHKKPGVISPYSNYYALVETLNRTPRMWNTSHGLLTTLKYISWTLNIDINVLGFKQAGMTHYCPHAADYYFLCYIFQNTTLKLMRKSSYWKPIIILEYQKQYYIPQKYVPFPVQPCLIDQSPLTAVTLNDKISIDHKTISKILQNEPVDFPISLLIYTNYQYVKVTHTKEISKHIIKKYENPTSNHVLHLFLAPHLPTTTYSTSTYTFDLFQLTLIKDSGLFHPNDILNYKHLTEGKSVYQTNSSKSGPLLNQDHCICDHPDMEELWDIPKYADLANTHFQTRFLYENLKALGLLNTYLERALKVCSEISFLSYDTEALNRQIINLHDGTFYDEFNFENHFSDTVQKKVIHGEQQLYIIGLCDIIPKMKTVNLLEKYLPQSLFIKIIRYVFSDVDHLRSHLSWNYCKSLLDPLPLENCAEELLLLFENNPVSEHHIKTFHLGKNHIKPKNEPSHGKTIQMIYRFLTYIYQRNILTSIIKYILLKPLLAKFESSKLIEEKRGIFYLIYKRLQEIIFESVLTAFNGQNYDNILLCNNLVIIMTKLNEKIKIFKKGASLSTINIFVKHNLNRLRDIINMNPLQLKSKLDNRWLMKLYIKDVRNLVAANMSLDKIGKLFNLNVSKLCFPYEQATTIKKLAQYTSLHPFDDSFWQDNFSNKTVNLETRLAAQELFQSKQFNNLYEYGEYYLKQDCLLLHSVLLTLFRTYLQESINIFIRRNYSQSSLSYQEFFIVEPSKQIEKNLAPKIIKNPFFNYFIKQSVTGGLCTSFVHGNISNQTVINEHLNDLEHTQHMGAQYWPNFQNLAKTTTNPCFDETPIGISTIDIRSLYPSAAVKKLPVGTPLCYSRYTVDDFPKVKDKKRTLSLQQYCQKARESGNHNTDIMRLINTPPRFHTEFYALNHYLHQLPAHITVLRFQSAFTAMGQLCFTQYPLDGFLSYYDPTDNKVHIKLIQYQSVYYHGHKSTCSVPNSLADIEKAKITADVKEKIVNLGQHYIDHFQLSNIDFEYVEIFDCDFYQHRIPKKLGFCPSYQKSYNYNDFLHDIFQKKLTGFLLVKNLQIKKEAQNPLFGFVIQKVEYGTEVLSDYTKAKHPEFKSASRVVSINKSKSFMVISTEYLNWLHINFGFENPPDIYHALFFQLDTYLKPYIENKLRARKQIKELIKNEKNAETRQIYEIQSELIKLMLNSCYGFTLCNVASTKFKTLENRKSMPSIMKAKNRIKTAIQFSDKVFLIELNKSVKDSFQTLLGQVGSYILFHSKIILIKRLNFLLRYLNPTKAQLLYMDTDSAHFLLKHKEFIDNVDDQFKEVFQRLFDKHFDSGSKLSGIWVQEGFFEKALYIGEKSYVLSNDSNPHYLTHMKGLNQYFQHQFVQKRIDPQKNSVINYNIFQKSNDGLIFKTFVSKNLFRTYVPCKRYFVTATGSLPLTMDDNLPD